MNVFLSPVMVTCPAVPAMISPLVSDALPDNYGLKIKSRFWRRVDPNNALRALAASESPLEADEDEPPVDFAVPVAAPPA